MTQYDTYRLYEKSAKQPASTDDTFIGFAMDAIVAKT